MGRPTRPLHDAGTHGTFERRSLRQAAHRGRLTTRPDLPETWSGPALLHHAEGHDRHAPRPQGKMAPDKAVCCVFSMRGLQSCVMIFIVSGWLTHRKLPCTFLA